MAFGTDKSVLFREVSLIQGPYREVPLYVLSYVMSVCVSQVVDENEMLEYQLKLDHWTAKQEEKKHTFTISHPHKHISDEEVCECYPLLVCMYDNIVLLQGRPQTIPKQKTLHKSTLRPRSSSNSDLRGTRYQVLPPIGANPPNITYEEWKTQ